MAPTKHLLEVRYLLEFQFSDKSENIEVIIIQTDRNIYPHLATTNEKYITLFVL